MDSSLAQMVCSRVLLLHTVVVGVLLVQGSAALLGFAPSVSLASPFTLFATATVRVVGSLGFMRWTEAVIGL